MLTRSLSARRAWIEMQPEDGRMGAETVALRKESVDRNNVLAKGIKVIRVALRKESVDRNHAPKYRRIPPQVALRKESVDRNDIRIAPIDSIIDVALRKESVDRNILYAPLCCFCCVALRKESVDRNKLGFCAVLLERPGRSPQGERG